MYERRLRPFIILIIFLAVCPLIFACNTEGENGVLFNGGLIVECIDVGEGDATFIRLPDGKSMLIDTGLNTIENREKVFSTIRKYTNSIDYFVLSHPDDAHYGNAEDIINEFNIEKAFVPYLLDGTVYPSFYLIINLLKSREVDVKISQQFINLSTSDYVLVFLSPEFDVNDGSYSLLNQSPIPNDSLADDVSPIIYLEYNGVRFLFTGDAGKREERVVMEVYETGLYDRLLIDERKIILENIDFYKLSSHGGDSANSIEFLTLLSPKNAIISVGGGSNGNPSTEVLYNLHEVNENYNLYRTDRDKTICVNVSLEGTILVNKGK